MHKMVVEDLCRFGPRQSASCHQTTLDARHFTAPHVKVFQIATIRQGPQHPSFHYLTPPWLQSDTERYTKCSRPLRTQHPCSRHAPWAGPWKLRVCAFLFIDASRVSDLRDGF